MKISLFTYVNIIGYIIIAKNCYICIMRDRLLQVMNHLGLTATRLADEIGVQRSGISHILSGRNQPSYDFIVKIMNKYPEINIEWLLNGNGKLLKTNESAVPDKTNEPSAKREDPTRHISKFTNVNSAESVILLYHDGTFKHYQPAGKD